MKPYYSDKMTEIYLGDCLDIMPILPGWDSVITDAPYMVGGVSSGNLKSKHGSFADMLNSAHWFSAWMSLAYKKIKDAGFLACFGNWRSLPVLICAMDKAGISPKSCVVWNKKWPGTAGPTQFRGVYEIILTASKNNAKILDRSQTDIIACKWQASNMGKTGHPAEKPVALMRELIFHLSTDGNKILDPFMGSGTTLVASKSLKRKSIGIDANERYCEIAAKRLMQENLF